MTNLVTARAVGETRRPLHVYSGGFLTDSRVRRILDLAGWDIRLGLPAPGGHVGVWGARPTAARGARIAAWRGAGLVRVEDAFLRSVLPGRRGEPPLGLLIDRTGVHFDPAAPSDLETLLATHSLDDPALIARATEGIARLRALHLSKYNGFDPDLPAPDPGYVLVVDQTAGDASVRASAGDPARFAAMLTAARADHPGARIVVKTHPEVALGLRPGCFAPGALTGTALCADPVSPWRLLDGARAVYTLSSQLGFEAILAGHRPAVFGQPFYAGWGLTDDRGGLLPRRRRNLTPAQLFAATMILAPVWYDPYRDRLCPFETAVDILESQVRAWRDDHRGWTAVGMRLWKRGPLQAAFGRTAGVRFDDRALSPTGTRRLMVWAGKATPALIATGAVQVEDGFLRSRGLGADLVAPLSLCLDDLGIYYDPRSESRLERLIGTEPPPGGRTRAAALIERLRAAGLSKYNLGGQTGLPPGLPAGPRILVPGQVEDDASILTGAGDIRTNRALLQAVRAAYPGAVVLFKPHPDVEAGLRQGGVPDVDTLADAVLPRADPMALLAQVDEVWTMTSTLGFEALLRGVPVTCLGAPFYAGWGLTRDLGPVPARRAGVRPDLVQLAHAALIAYPRYFDPATGLPCPVEVAVDRLASGTLPRRSAANRALAKLQGRFAGFSALWR